MKTPDRNIPDKDSLLLGNDLLYRIAAFQYHETLDKIMEKDVFVCRPEDPVQRIAGEMAERRISSVIVTDKDLRPLGIVTERDMVREIVACSGESCNRSISTIMTPDPVSLTPDATLFDALSILSKHKVNHLPIVHLDKVAGIITIRQIMHIRYTEPLVIIGELEHAESAADLKGIRKNLIELVKEKIQTNTDPVDIVTMLSLINIRIHKLLLKKAIEECGSPPADFCFFVTGSSGRKENLLFPDQDFCVIIEDHSDNDFEQYDSYFKKVSQKFSDLMNSAGFTYCTGEIMGQNPLWRKSVSEWTAHVSEILKTSGPKTVRYATLIFDSAYLYGNRALFEKYISHAYAELSKNWNVLRQMHDEEEGMHEVPLGWFNTFITEKGPHKGEIDMKRSGLLFIIETARILALKHGIRETSTLARLQALVEKEIINKEDSEYFENAYRVILYHTLKAQTANYLTKKTANYYLDPNELSARDRDILKQAFKAIGNLQDIVGSEFGELIL